MKIDKVSLVALLVALDFKKAPEWDDAKLLDRAALLPTKVAEDDIPEEFKKLYAQLADCPKDEALTFDGAKAPKGKAEPEAEKASKKKSKGKKPAAEEPARPISKKTGKPMPLPPKKVAVDAYGCRLGSITAKVNKVLSEKWQSEEEIAEAAEVTLDQARGRLYYAATGDGKILEKRRRTEYRLTEPKPAKK